MKSGGRDRKVSTRITTIVLDKVILYLKNVDFPVNQTMISRGTNSNANAVSATLKWLHKHGFIDKQQGNTYPKSYNRDITYYSINKRFK